MPSFEFTEQTIRFTFNEVLTAEVLDRSENKGIQGMMLVDFLVETEDRIYLIEAKDLRGSKGKNADNPISGNLITQTLVPKARDSYSYLVLMERAQKPVEYILVFQKLIEAPFLINRRDKLRAKLKQESDRPWAKDYVRECHLLNFRHLNEKFPQFSAQEVS